MPRPPTDPALVAKAEKLYRETTLTTEEIAEALGVTRRTISRWLKAADVPTRYPATNRPPKETTP